MIAPAKPAPRARRRRQSTAWHVFLRMLPKIVRHAKVALPRLGAEARADALEEVVANAAVAYARLAQLGKEDVAYPTPLATYAVAQYKAGRRVGNRLNVHEVLSEYAQQRKGFRTESLDHFDEDEGVWQEAVVQDTRRSPVPEIVSFRVDFSDWLSDLPRRNRRIVENLALGHTTGEVAKRFDVTPGRVSQLRRELAKSWKEFVSEPGGNDAG